MSTTMGTTTSADTIDIDVYARGEDGRGVTSTEFFYQASNSCTIVPTGTWSSSFITPNQGEFLWIKTLLTYNDNTTLTSYTISYFAIDGVDGGWYTPSVDNAGNLSWTPSDPSLPPVQTVNIRGPKGETGSVKFIYVNTLPITDIQNDAFYITPAATPTANKRYDEYYYMNNNWEKMGEDLSGYYNKTQIDGLFNNFVADLVKINNAAAGTVYYMPGVTESGNKTMYLTGVSYQKQSGAPAGEGFVDGQTITTNLFFEIS